MLNEIVEATRQRLNVAGVVLGESRPALRDFKDALMQPGLQVIAEFKRRSPSAGPLGMDLDPTIQAARYASGGAAAISVLTEPDYFSGSIADLAAVRAAVDLPILRKDFIIDERQVAESREVGADALLLIVAALEVSQLAALLEAAREVGIAALVEAHDEGEAAIAAEVGADLIGINNRNLRTFETDLGVAERVAPQLPKGPVLVAESGVSTPTGAGRMAAAGYDAILVGEALVRADDPAALIGLLRAVSQ
ncbi:MAG: indole-3-glycerol phosphate synthase TrpC [Acidimicrobiia bacterium]|nr:indole-3-glycerol phosphate synthase TrpC [Acidimicrobiia bacterium]